MVCGLGRDSNLCDLTANSSEAASLGLWFMGDVDCPLVRDTRSSDLPPVLEVRKPLPFDIDLVVTPILLEFIVRIVKNSHITAIWIG